MAALNPEAYRYPHENIILAFTIGLVLLVIALTATATFCGSVLFVLAMVGLSYFLTRSQHAGLLRAAHAVTPQTAPALAALIAECRSRLGAEVVQTFVTPANVLNAYTFGLSTPKVIVIYEPLLRLMDEDELRFVVGHELGHVRLGHTWLNSLVGGMAGIPSPFAAAAVLHLAFRWWNRACEYSADRAGLLACGEPHKAISALIRLGTGTSARTSAGLESALQKLDAEDEEVANVVSELLATHPLIIRRIEALRRYAASDEYRRLITATAALAARR